MTPWSAVPDGARQIVDEVERARIGLPVARDMDGYARADLFTREFAAERPVTFIPSYR